MKAAGHQILFALREKAGLKRSERNPASGHEEKLVFMPTQKAFEKAIKDNGEGIDLLRILSGRGDMDPKPAEDAAFLAMHLNYKGNWEFRSFSDEQINLMREMRKHSAGLQHYSDSPWDRLKREKIFAQWPLKSYLPEMEKLQKLTRDYWRAREKAGSTLGTTKLMLGVKPAEALAVKYEGMTARRITAGNIEAETKAFTNLTNELEEMRKKPAETNSNFTPTPFDLHRYTNSDVANSHKPQPIQNTTSDPKTVFNLQLVHKAMQEIEQFLGRKIEISSGFRTKALNDILEKSATNSNHMHGYAADLAIDKKDHQKVMKWIKANMESGNNGLPIINQAIAYNTIIHIDIGPKKEPKPEKTRYMQDTATGKVAFVFED